MLIVVIINQRAISPAGSGIIGDSGSSPDQLHRPALPRFVPSSGARTAARNSRFANHLFTSQAAQMDVGSTIAMATAADIQPDRRRSNRTALQLNAMMREGSKSRVKARVIDISTHGCRVECTSAVADDSWVWLNISGLETQYCRVAWHCQEFIGLEFAKPLSDAVFERLLADHQQLPESTINDLRKIASRTHWLARQAGDGDIAILAELSRKCAEEAVVEGLRRSETPKKS
jgi:hypothetical protein